MNNTQRKFLVEKIQEKTKQKIDELGKEKISYPNASNYFFKAALTDTLELRSPEHIKSVLKEKAKTSKHDANWLSGERMGWEREKVVKLNIEDLLVEPQDYVDELNRVREHNGAIDARIKELKIYLDTIEMRIHLASDKTLQSLINDIDDLGDVRLIDSNLKLLNK